jgi:hypothetical protein
MRVNRFLTDFWKGKNISPILIAFCFLFSKIIKLIQLTSKSKELVFDPFLGTGSTILACKETNRNYFGIEIDRKFYKIALHRINMHSKQ